MTVYVDELHQWPTKIRCFQAGSCHLMADDVDELHAFAQRLRLKRKWFQPLSSPHYDLTATKRARAIELGAVFVPGKEQARRRIAARFTGITTLGLVPPWIPQPIAAEPTYGEQGQLFRLDGWPSGSRGDDG